MTKRWLTWLLVATVWAIGCYYLGLWQWHKWQTKTTMQHRVSSNYNATPVPLASLFSHDRPLPASDQWKQVKAQGHYVGKTLMVRNRPNSQGNYGYEVVNVFETGDQRVLVDRGWVANGANAATPASRPAAPSGNLTIIGWARPSEKSLNRPPVPGELESISVRDVEVKDDEKIVDGYLRMRSERASSGETPARPLALNKPSQSESAGINLSYAIQWWVGLVAGYAFVVLRARREHLDELEAVSADPAQDSSAGANAKAPAKPKKPKKTRIWDEEDE